jgi:hypothetical protein|tara:strand:+ start:1348 stop:2145 length:798 start_codon:yes stop_codon:yes gene_type:complete
MNSKNDILSILNAVNEINSNQKKKSLNTSIPKSSIPQLNKDLIISPDVDRLILEAEKYKKSVVGSPIVLSDQNQLSELKKADVLILTNEVIDNSLIENDQIITLRIQIKNLKDSERKLLSQIDDLQKEVILLKKKNFNVQAQNAPQNSPDNTRETLKSIYLQVEKQKKVFLELKIHSTKIERDSSVYKENYERLVVENHELKNRLKITKEQIVSHETNKNELLTALDQLNEILSKNNIVGNISPDKSSYEKKNPKKVTEAESADD